MIPLLHDLTDETVLVFGGGPVGARKARRFAREARVMVLAPEFADADFGGAHRVRAAPAPEDVPRWLDQAAPALVVAATNDAALNARVESESRERGLLVNRTDTHGDRDPGSVVVPATVRDGDVVVAVSTGGTAPALSKHLRERLDDELANAGAMAELAGDIRERLQAEEVNPSTRREAIRAVVRDRQVWKHLGMANTKSEQQAHAVVNGIVGDDT
ncbi:bifunctional precorrin-2 dehydrogenase/sirohydrochlorin ferrochelatase [Halosegnis sp.]|uniref:precorrin-2 dehydrogenase/sirohydrochlorin ferrochelatase family protein n=1 Tax=Halosegnis sp. TaxID=2864959 RepID=UPI0035D4076B